MKKNNLKTLGRINNNISIERKYKKELQKFSNSIIKSVNYKTKAIIRGYEKRHFRNIAERLRFSFEDLLTKYEKEAEVLSDFLAKKFLNRAFTYVNNSLKMENKDFAIPNTAATSEVVKTATNENISLIKSIPSEIIDRVRGAVYSDVLNLDLQRLKRVIVEVKGVSDRRAHTIARDQISKAIQNFTMSKSRDLGFKYYKWITAGDERVSTGAGGHKMLNGRIYAYDEPTAIIDSNRNRGIPSQRVNCRCTSASVILEPYQKLKRVRDAVHGDYYILE